MPPTEDKFEALSKQFELLEAELQNKKKASAEERTEILKRMRALIDTADQLVKKRAAP